MREGAGVLGRLPYRRSMSTELLGGDSSPDLPDYTKVGPYRLLQQLGEGGMGVVHLALDPNGKAVALKVLRPHIAHDPDARARLAREVETLGRVRAARVAPVLDADIEGDRPYIVTRYVPAPSLDEVVRENGPMSGEELLRLGRGLAESLHEIHQADVVHRDLKPGNVLMLDGDPVLIDFGIAHVADEVRITMTGMVMGTPGYLAPEVVEGEAVSEATDWWGWAATLAFAASGRPPFGKGPMEAVLARVGRGEADLSGVDPALAPLLEAALSPDPEVRPDDAEVVAALEEYAQGRPVTEVLPARRSTAAPTQAISQTPPADATREVESDPTRRLPAEPSPAYPSAQQAPPPQRAPRETGPPEPRDPRSPAPPSWEPVAAPAAQPGGDPRIGRPARSGVLTGLVLLVSALAAVAPLVAVGIALAWSVFARTVDASMTALVMRRHERGPRRSDVAVGFAAGPWHLVRGVLTTVVAVLLPALIGASAAFCTALALTTVTAGNPRPGEPLPLGVGMLLAALMAWWGPGGPSLRRGSRSVARWVAPTAPAASGLAVILVVLAIAAAAWAYLGAGTVWWPLPSAPFPFDSTGLTLP